MPDAKKSSSLALGLSRQSRRERAHTDAAQQPEAHWPLLGSRSGRATELPIPALQAQEREARQALGQRRAAAPAPSVSVPGLGQKLSRGLSRLTARAQQENEAVHSVKLAPQPSPATPPPRKAVQPTPPFAAPSLHKKLARQEEPEFHEPEVAEQEEPAVPPPNAGRFRTATASEQKRAGKSESIQGMFARLASGQDKASTDAAGGLRLPSRRK